MRRFRIVLASVALWLASAAVATAQDKIEIGVSFSLRARHFTDELTDAQIAQLNDMASAGIARALNSGVGFLNFKIGSADPHQLSIELDRSDRSSNLGESEFRLFVKLNGPGFARPLESQLIFQTITNYGTNFTSIDALSRQIEQTFSDANQRQLVSELLSQVAIADHADFQRETSSWIIHRDRVVLCLGSKSRLIVLGKVPNEVGALRELDVAAVVINVDNPDDWVFAKARDNPEDPVLPLLLVASPDQLKTEKVVVAEYMSCNRATTVPGSGYSGGGDGQ